MRTDNTVYRYAIYSQKKIVAEGNILAHDDQSARDRVVQDNHEVNLDKCQIVVRPF